MDTIPYANYTPAHADIQFEVSNVPIFILSAVAMSERILMYRVDREFNIGNLVNSIVSALQKDTGTDNITIALDIDLASPTFLISHDAKCSTYNSKTNRQATSTVGEAFYMKQGNNTISWNRGVCTAMLTMRVKFIRGNNGIHSFSQTLLSVNIVNNNITLNRYIVKR